MKTKVKRTTSVLLTILMLATIIPLATARAADASTMQVTATWNAERGRYIDSMEYKFVPDEEVLGSWKVYDFVETIESYDPTQKNWTKDLSYYGNTFYSDGTMTVDSEYNPGIYKWTKGFIFWDSWEVIPAYEIKHIGLNTYMFLQWKSGDYYYRGSTPSYYVFIKEVEDKPQNVAPNLDNADSWAKSGIQSAYAKGFVPDDLLSNYASAITRQQFCRMAVKYVEYATGKSSSEIMKDYGVSIGTNPFTDTSDQDILVAHALGITAGTSETTFSPNDSFTREQAATMLRNACKVIGMDVDSTESSGYSDATNIAAWAADGVNFCKVNGIMAGTGNNTFSPKSKFTRQESIVTFDNLNTSNLPTVPNLSSAAEWAKVGITSAVNKGFVPRRIQNEYNTVITREEYCRLALGFVEYYSGHDIDTILNNLGLSVDQNAFNDTSDYYILAAYALGITSGTGPKTFSPNDSFTREQAAVMTMNTWLLFININSREEIVKGCSNVAFSDVDNISEWAVDGVNLCVYYGFMSGTGNNMFTPNGSFTRQESIVLFNNLNFDMFND